MIFVISVQSQFKYLFGKNFANIAKDKYIECEGYEQRTERHRS